MCHNNPFISRNKLEQSDINSFYTIANLVQLDGRPQKTAFTNYNNKNASD